VSIQDIRQNPQDTSNFYLANIYQANIADPNRSNTSSSLPASPPPFSPPTYAVWVNSLWFLSLAISITCALFATLLQQWARRYLKVTRARSSLHKRAKIRSFFAEGVKKSHILMVVEALPTLLHASLFLFFAGLAVFVWNVHLTIFKVVLSWISVCTALYGSITLVPIFRHDSPYHSPLTPLARFVVAVVLIVINVLYVVAFLSFYRFLLWFRCSGPLRASGQLFNWLRQVTVMIRMTPEEAALKSSSETDARAFAWTFDSLDEDHELERFFSGIPGFHSSKVLKEPLRFLNDLQKLDLLEAVIRLLDRTFSSNLLPDQVRRQRADICANAINLVVHTPEIFPRIVRRLASEDQYGPAETTRIVDFVRRWDGPKGEDSTLEQATLSIVVARVQRHDDSWFTLASNELGIPETVLREYAAHGDNLSLAILIYVTRQQFIHIRNPSWPSKAISNVLRAASNFNVQDTSPILQHKFCALWNQIVREAQNTTLRMPEHLLAPIRNPYFALHHDTNSAPTRFSPLTGDDNINLLDDETYPLCHVAGHIHDDSASPSFPHIVPHNDAALSSGSPASPVAPPFPLPAPFHVDDSLTSVPPPDNSHPTCQTIESSRISVASPDQAAPSEMRGTVTLGIATPLPTPAISTSTPPPLFTSLPASVSLQHNANPLAPSCPPNLPSSVPSNLALDNILHIGSSLCSRLPMTRLITRNSYRYSQRFSRADLYD
jgi:hypothetical protein